jgi:dTDP-4-amino-4,6-dideoxygalactose transaminase
VRRGDDVLVPTLTFVAPANAVRYVGAHPVFVDAEPTYRQLDVDRAEAFVRREYVENARGWCRRTNQRRRLRAILAVDLLGHPCDLDAVLELADRFGLVAIDDAAQAFGATVRGRAVGTIAPVSVLSFNANKVMTTAGGGMLLAHDPEHIERARMLAMHAKQPDCERYDHAEVGFNYAMATAQAALGLSQLKSLPLFLERKRRVAARYAELLDGVPGLTLPVQAEWATSTFWMYTVHVPADRRTAVAEALKATDIQTRPLFEPMHRVRAHARAHRDDCPVAERLSATGLCLPCSTGIEDEQVQRVATTLREALSAG